MGNETRGTFGSLTRYFSLSVGCCADIAGFTAWSSQREPPQVFTLLETLYRSFDVIAGKLKVFKVETIGDCYMAGAQIVVLKENPFSVHPEQKCVFNSLDFSFYFITSHWFAESR